MSAPPLSPPPWRARWASSIVAPAGLDDARARSLWASAMLAADAKGANLAAVADELGVALRTLRRARDWLEAHDAALFARLRPRVTGVVADPAGAARAASAARVEASRERTKRARAS